MSDAKKPRVTKPRTGTLIHRKSGYCARYVVDEEGPDGLVRPRKAFVSFPGLHNKGAAKRRLQGILAKLARGELAPSEAKAEAERSPTFAEEARRIVEQQQRDGLKTGKERLSRLERYAFTAIGGHDPHDVGPESIRELLEEAGKTLSKQSVTHLRNDLGGIFGQLWRDNRIPENPVAKVKVPKKLREDRRSRVVLDDVELATFLCCPDVPDHLRLMVFVARAFGGQRTSDLHAWSWTHVDLEHWLSAEVYRPKTDGDEGESVLERLALPEVVSVPLKRWWKQRGQPTSGPVFPLPTGRRAGKQQGKRSHARELRRYLWIAGAHRPLEGFPEAMAEVEARRGVLEAALAKGAGRDERRPLKAALVAAEEGAKLRDALQTETERSRPVDFHSFRRQFNTALAAAGVNVQQAMALAGHKDARTHMRYVNLLQGAPLVTPAAALPPVTIWTLPVSDLPRADRLAIANPGFLKGDSSENRTRVTGVRGQCPNR